MHKALMAASAALVSATAVLAATDIPTRYSGSFPSDGVRLRISGTFTGKSLSLRFVVKANPGRDPTRTGNYSCSATSATQTRCTGTFSSGDGTYTGSQIVIVTWSAGKPTGMAFGH